MATDNTGPEQVSTTTILLVLATVFVALRFWARYNVAAKYGLLVTLSFLDVMLPRDPYDGLQDA